MEVPVLTRNPLQQALDSRSFYSVPVIVVNGQPRCAGRKWRVPIRARREAVAAWTDRAMPSASRSLLIAGPDAGALRDAAAALAAEFRAALATPGG